MKHNNHSQSSSILRSCRRAWRRVCRRAPLLRGAIALPLMLSFAASACTHNVDIHTPEGFAVLEDGGDHYAYRASSAEGVVLAVRNNDNEPHGDLTFWSGALDAHLERRGYVRKGIAEVNSADGVVGRQMRYEVQRRGRLHMFWFTVFVTDDKVVTVEAGGDEAYFQRKEEALGIAVRSLEVG